MIKIININEGGAIILLAQKMLKIAKNAANIFAINVWKISGMKVVNT